MNSRAAAGKIPSLDGLRCIAILLVFLSHVQMASGVSRFIPGSFGVTLFFFLSGYLITTLMRVEAEQTGDLSIRLFYIRRALRILPAFVLVLGCATLYGLHAGLVDPWMLFGQLMQITNYLIIWHGWTAEIAPYTDVYWSLAVEEHFYLAFPALFIALWRVRSRGEIAAWLLGACLVVMVWRCILTFGLGASPDRTYLGTDTRIDSILFGCVLALWGNPVLDPTRFAERTWKRLLLPLSVAVIVATFAADRPFRESVGYTIQGLCLFSVFVTAVRYPDWAPMRVLGWWPVRWIGVLSYAIYLVHPSMLAVSAWLVGTSFLPLTLMATTLTLVASAGIYFAVERPMGRLRQLYSVGSQPADPSRSTGSRLKGALNR